MKQPTRKETGATPRRKFDETYKRHAVELTLQGDRTVIAVAKELELPPWQLLDRVAISSSIGVEEVARKLLQGISYEEIRA